MENVGPLVKTKSDLLIIHASLGDDQRVKPVCSLVGSQLSVWLDGEAPVHAVMSLC